MNTQAAISGYTEIKSQTLSHESIGYNVVSAALAKAIDEAILAAK